MSQGTILIIGGGGKTGARVNARLRARGIATRPVSRSTETPFDWERPEGWAAAFDGIARGGPQTSYGHRELVPFALRLDCDDVACWERQSMPQVVIVHDFANMGWESRQTFDTFWNWFRSAVSDFIEFES